MESRPLTVLHVLGHIFLLFSSKRARPRTPWKSLPNMLLGIPFFLYVGSSILTFDNNDEVASASESKKAVILVDMC